jgi:hypothetical protein
MKGGSTASVEGSGTSTTDRQSRTSRFRRLRARVAQRSPEPASLSRCGNAGRPGAEGDACPGPGSGGTTSGFARSPRGGRVSLLVADGCPSRAPAPAGCGAAAGSGVTRSPLEASRGPGYSSGWSPVGSVASGLLVSSSAITSPRSGDSPATVSFIPFRVRRRSGLSRATVRLRLPPHPLRLPARDLLDPAAGRGVQRSGRDPHRSFVPSAFVPAGQYGRPAGKSV